MPGGKLVHLRKIHESIVFFRGERVLLDADLALLYQVETRALIQAVKRNAGRFPNDFMFQLTDKELSQLRSQTVISSWGGRRTRPYAFTEQGVAMLSSVLRSEHAVQVNIEIMRAFVRMRQYFSTHEELKKRIVDLEARFDEQLKVVFEAIGQLMESDNPPSAAKIIGFQRSEDPA
jgi:hypothetical protein